MGNVLIGIATLIYFGLLALIYGSSPRSGPDGVGFGWMLILGNFGFVLCLAIVTGIIGSKGGFSWIGSEGASRFLLVLVGFIVIMLGQVFILFGGEMEFSPAIDKFLRFVPAILPLLLLASAAILLNEGWHSVLTNWTFKIPLTIAFVFGLFAIGLLLRDSAQRAVERMEEDIEEEQQIHQNYHDIIDATDVMKDITYILGYTDANHYPDVRARALAKVKSRPDWQEELARQLSTAGAPKVFTFLASNEVEDPAFFAEPVREGLLMQAQHMRKEIRTAVYASHLSSDQFFWQVQRALRVADKFAGRGADYRPAVEEMLKALEEPCKLKKPNFRCKALLDAWLKDHE